MLKKKFVSQPSAIASYDYTDLLTAKSYKKFYGLATLKTTGVVEYLLVTSEVKSSYLSDSLLHGITARSGLVTSGTLASVKSVTYESTFDVPLTIEGQSYVNVTAGSTASGVNGRSLQVKTSIYKNAVLLVTSTTSIDGMPSTAAEESHEYCLSLNIPKTYFNKGDALKLKVDLWGRRDGGANNIRFGFGQDPADRNDPHTAGIKTIEDTHSTKMEFHVPFVTML